MRLSNNRSIRWGVLAVICLLALLPSTRAATPKQVNDAVDKAKAFIYAHQKNGLWEMYPDGYTVLVKTRGLQGGMTVLTAYALLAAGENPQQPALAKALEQIKGMDLKGVYPLAMRCQIWLILPPKPETLAAARRDANELMNMMKTEGDARGMFDYVASGRGGGYSHSRSQYAVLGVWAAAQMGVEVPGTFWHLAEEAWLGHQDASGGWSYLIKGTGPGGVTPGMTAPGICTLYITQEFLHASDGIGCRGNLASPAIDAGIKWLATHFNKVATEERYARDAPYTTLFSVERAALASGLKRFGAADWYEKGADWLIKNQHPDGSFRDLSELAPGQKSASPPHMDTCFALLFLSRGRAPVLVNKLQYGIDSAGDKKIDAHWNERPREVANITRWFGRQTERFFNWQIVSMAHPEDLYDAPILYLSGNQSLGFTADQVSLLRAYVEGGGMIIGNADCANNPFADSFRALGSKLFPLYEFRELPANHSIYTGQQFDGTKWRTHPRLMGLSNGVRELMLLFPQDDPGKLWQMQSFTARPESSQLPADIFLYATDKLLLEAKGQFAPIKPNGSQVSRTINLMRLQYKGNWNPEPGGWRRLSAIMHNRHQTGLEISGVELGAGKLTGPGIAHLTGTNPVTFDDKSRQEIKAFVSGGGTLIVDAAGGSTEFAESMDKELAAIFREDAKQLANALPQDHAIYTATGKPAAIAYRTAALKTLGQSNAPRLRGITLNGRLAVIFSREDLSNGLVGHPVDGVIGYQPATAESLMCGILLGAVR